MVKRNSKGKYVSDLQDRVDRLRSAGFSLGYLDPADMSADTFVPAWRVGWEYYQGSKVCTVTGEPDGQAMPFVDFSDVAADDGGFEQCDTGRRSNFRVLLRQNEFHEPDLGRPLFVKVGYGRTEAIGAFVEDLSDEVIAMMVGLKEQYPVLDEEDMSALEQEEITASWDGWLRSELYGECGRMHRHNGAMQVIWDSLGEDVVEGLFWNAVREEAFGSNVPEHYGNEVVWGPIDRIVDTFRAVLIKAYAAGRWPVPGGSDVQA